MLPPLFTELPLDTLYERLGGDKTISELTGHFFDLVDKSESLEGFFVDVPFESIRLHQGLFFKVIFGVEEEKPSADELLDYMILTHVRLFRDLDLDATHFDTFMGLFQDAMIETKISKPLQDEVLAILLPLRVAFEYGALVAKREKTMPREVRKIADTASIKTFREDRSEVKLPAGIARPPRWLIELLGGRNAVRAWTCGLTHRFTVEDSLLSQTFMTLSYMDMEPYCHNFLRFALGFLSGNNEKSISALRAVRFPRGLKHPNVQITKEMFRRMVGHFFATGYQLTLEDRCIFDLQELQEISEKLLKNNMLTFIGTCNYDTTSSLGTAEFEAHHSLRHDASETSCRTTKSLEEDLAMKEKDFDRMKSTQRRKKTRILDLWRRKLR